MSVVYIPIKILYDYLTNIASSTLLGENCGFISYRATSLSSQSIWSSGDADIKLQRTFVPVRQACCARHSAELLGEASGLVSKDMKLNQ